MESGGPQSLATSFSSSNNENVSERSLSAKVRTANKTVDAQMLALNNWDSLKYADPPSDHEESSRDAWNRLADPSFKAGQQSRAAPAASTPKSKGPSLDHHRPMSSSEERERSIAIHRKEIKSEGPYALKFPDFFRYGIRFKPGPGDTDIYRTIVISGLSKDTTMGQILQNVRGGMLFRVHLLDTWRFMGSNSALVVFLYEHGAFAYDEYTSKHPIIINGQKLRIKLVKTATYPIDPKTRNAIEVHHHTRCLEVHNFPRHVPAARLLSDFHKTVDLRGNAIEHMRMRKDRVLELGFASVNQAGHAFALLTNFRLYMGSRTRFAPDPCAQPVETLLKGHKDHSKHSTDLELAAATALPEDLDASSDNEPVSLTDACEEEKEFVDAGRGQTVEGPSLDGDFRPRL